LKCILYQQNHKINKKSDGRGGYTTRTVAVLSGTVSSTISGVSYFEIFDNQVYFQETKKFISKMKVAAIVFYTCDQILF
jgi:hypothetical protein